MSRMCPFLMGTPRQNQSLLQRLRLGVEAGEKKVRVGFSDELDVEKKWMQCGKTGKEALAIEITW